MTLRERFNKIKEAFDIPVQQPAAAAPVVAPVVASTPTTFKLKNGTDISIAIKDPAVNPLPSIGDAVTINGVAATEGEYEFEDGSKITVDALGMVLTFTPVEPVTQPEFNAPAQQPAPVAPVNVSQFSSELPTKEKITEDFNTMLAKFATGTPEERITNLEVVARALMEYSFGWQIREQQQKAIADQAINIYKQDLTTAQTAVTTAQTQLEKHEKTLKGMFELVEKIIEEPATDPKTLPDNKKEGFMSAKEKRLQAISDNLKKQKEAHKN